MVLENDADSLERTEPLDRYTEVCKQEEESSELGILYMPSDQELMSLISNAHCGVAMTMPLLGFSDLEPFSSSPLYLQIWPYSATTTSIPTSPTLLYTKAERKWIDFYLDMSRFQSLNVMHQP